MPRPRKRRHIGQTPPAVFFKPQGVPLEQLRGVVLSLEGFEALRLVDALGLSQEEAAARMEVSRPTLCRILGEARSVVARAVTSGWAIRVEQEAPDEAERSAAPCRGRGCGRRRGAPQPEEEPS